MMLLFLLFLCFSGLAAADTDLVSVRVDKTDSGSAIVTVEATKIAAAHTTITFARLGAPLECPATKATPKQPNLIDVALGDAYEGESLRSDTWKLVDTENGARQYTTEISGAMLRMLWQREEARDLGHAVSVTGGAVSAMVLACVSRVGEDGIETIDSKAVEICMGPNSCTVPRAVVTGVYSEVGREVHVALETRVHPACWQEQQQQQPYYLKNSFVKMFNADGTVRDDAAFTVTPMGSSAKGCEDSVALAGDIVECLQTWDVAGLVRNTESMLDLAVGFAMASEACSDEIVVQTTLELINAVGDVAPHKPLPVAQDVQTPTNHLHVQVRTATESAKSETHMRGLGDGAKAYAFNDGERNCLEIRSDHPSLLDDHTSLKMSQVVLHRCAPKTVVEEKHVRTLVDDDRVVVEPLAVQECVANGDLHLVRNGRINHGFAGFMNGHLAYDETTANLCFMPDVDVFQAGVLEIEWEIARTPTQSELREAALRQRSERNQRNPPRWKPALELELEEQERRRAREEEYAAAAPEEQRHMGCHGPECNGTIIIPIHIGCQDGHFFADHVNQCLPWPMYGCLRFMRVAWIPCLLVTIVVLLACTVCYGALMNRHDHVDHESYKIH